MENQTIDNSLSTNSEVDSGQSVILANHDAVLPEPPMAPIPPVTSSQLNSTPPSNKNLFKILLIAILFLVFIVGAMLVGIEIGKNQSVEQANDQIEPSITSFPSSSPSKSVATEAASPTVLSPTASQSADMETYQNMTAGFSIKYPTGWRKVEAENWIGFGPKEIGEDVVWGVSFYKNSEKTVKEIKDEIGKQFTDRVQAEKAITINGLEATELITTTPSSPDWYSVTIIVDSPSGLFAIGNGAQTDVALNKMIKARTSKESNLSFEDFYSSFRVY